MHYSIALLAYRMMMLPDAPTPPAPIRLEDTNGRREENGIKWETWALGPNGSDIWLPDIDDKATMAALPASFHEWMQRRLDRMIAPVLVKGRW